MMGNFKALADWFMKEFPKDKFSYKSDDQAWVYAAPSGLTTDNSIHYELIQRGDLFFVEFHIEGNQHSTYVSRAYECFNSYDNLRRFCFFTYYSSKYWQTRTPVFTKEDIKNDVVALRSIVETEIIASTSSETANANENDNESQVSGNHGILSPKEVASRLQNNTLAIPNVQRGKVWNVARIGTLWDSMLRNFPIGSFSVQETGERLELLDGQQRSYAISLGFGEFPRSNETGRKEPVLWLECSPEAAQLGEKKFLFYVTTCSHPWGYRLAEDEMRNSTLTADEKCRAVNGAKGHEENAGKPYPDELYPYFSKMPVPVRLLTTWFSESQSQNWDDFIQWCKTKSQEKTWRWLEKIDSKKPKEDYWEKLCRAFQSLKRYEIFLTKSNVDADDIALYFTRIGRGGVLPSDEELAYSVLKSKIGQDFRSTIENISNGGMAAPARIAHLAIRCFASGKNEFYCGSILEQTNKIVRERREEFLAFMNGFQGLIQKIDTAMKLTEEERFMPWHRCRYCTYASGDLYLFLLLTARDAKNELPHAKNELPRAVCMAEYIHCFANDVRRTLRIVRENGLQNGLSEALKISRYGTPILEFPISPETFPEAKTIEDFGKWWNESQHHAAVELLKRGYGNQKAYSILLWACGNTISQRDYDPNLAEWSDESCPWDYDHVLPRSWFEKIAGTKEAVFCNELKNSIGNLAPLPFSLNRSLSDNERSSNYPCLQDDQESQTIQKQLYIDRAKIAGKIFCDPEKGSAEREKFCLATLERFKKIYNSWFQKIVNQWNIFGDPQASNRWKLFYDLSKKISNSKIFYVDGERQYPRRNNLDWFRPWLAIGVVTQNNFVAVASDGNQIEVGLRRRPESVDIEGKNIWWRDNQCNTNYKFGENNLEDKLIEKLTTLLNPDNQKALPKSIV